MILNAHRNTSPRLAKARLGIITAATTLVAVLILYAGPRLVLAQNATSASNPSTVAAAGGDEAQSRPPAVPAPPTAFGFAQADPPAAPEAEDVQPQKGFKTLAPPSEDAFTPPPRGQKNPRPPMKPQAPRSPDSAAAGANIDERLDRLERMMKSLMAQQNPKGVGPEFSYRGPLNSKVSRDFQLESKRETEVAAEMDKRAAKEAAKAMKLEEKWRGQDALPDELRQQLDALHQQRELLQRQMEKLNHQIEEIMRQHKRIAEQKQRAEEDSGGGARRP